MLAIHCQAGMHNFAPIVYEPTSHDIRQCFINFGVHLDQKVPIEPSEFWSILKHQVWRSISEEEGGEEAAYRWCLTIIERRKQQEGTIVFDI